MEKLNRPYFLTLAGLIAAVLTFLSAPALTAALGPEGRGTVYSALAASMLLTTALTLGSSASLRIEYTTSTGRLGKSFFTQFSASLVFLILGVLAFNFALPNPILNLEDLLMVGLATAINIVVGNLMSIALAKHHYLSAGLSTINMSGGQLLAAVLLLMNPLLPAESLVIGFFLLASLVNLVLLNWATLRYRRGDLEVSHSFLVSYKNMGSHILQTLATRLDLLVAGIAFGVGIAGQYSLALLFSIPVILIHGSLVSAYLGEYIELTKSSRQDPLTAPVRQLGEVASLVLTVAVGSAALGLFAIPVLFTSEFLSAVGYVIPLVFAAAGAVLAFFTGELLIADGRGAKSFKYTMLSTASFTLFAILLQDVGIDWFLVIVNMWYWSIFVINSRILGVNLRTIGISPSALIRTINKVIRKPFDMI